MIVDEKLKKYGVDKDIILAIHRRTKIRDCIIKEAEFQTVNKNPWNETEVLTIKLHLEYKNSYDRRHASMDISLKKLTKLKREIRLKQLGI